jgi:hypothetical protein
MEEGMSIAVLLDVSGSMQGEPLAAVKQGLSAFVARARETDRISIATFANDVRWDADWGATAENIRTIIQGLQVRGTRTALYDAVAAGVDHFDQDSTLPARHRVIVISDGFDQGSSKTLAQAIEAARLRRIQVDTVGITIKSGGSGGALPKLSADTRGEYRAAPNLDLLKQRIEAGITDLLETPVATFAFEELTPDGKQHVVGVRWKPQDALDSMAVTLPQAAQWSFGGRLRKWQALVGLGVVLAAVALLFLRPRRQALPAAAPARAPAPKPVEHRSPTISETPPARSAGYVATALETPGAAPAAGIAAASRPVASVVIDESIRRTKLQAEFPAPAPGAPSAVLHVLEGPHAGLRFGLESEECWIGANDNNHLQLAHDPLLSGNHCCIRFEGGFLRLYDHASTNGTRLNGERLTDAARLLSPADRIQIGQSTITLDRIAR